MILKLKDILKNIDNSEIGGGGGEITMSAPNVDDVFRLLRKRKVKEVRVDFNEMFLLTVVALSYIQRHEDKNDFNWDALELVREGKVDKFFGVELVLEE